MLFRRLNIGNSLSYCRRTFPLVKLRAWGGLIQPAFIVAYKRSILRRVAGWPPRVVRWSLKLSLHRSAAMQN